MLNRVSRKHWLRAIVFGGAGGIFAALAVGIPTDVVSNPWFTRMTPVRTQDYIFLALTIVLSMVLAASYALPQVRACATQQGKAAGGGILSVLAVGCPVCNKAVLLLLGTSGAFTYFEPVQPLIGGLSLVLLGVAVYLRWKPLLLDSLNTEPRYSVE